MTIRSLLAIALLAGPACPPPPVPPPQPPSDAGAPDASLDAARPDAGPSTTCRVACAAIAAICSQPQPSTCEVALERADAGRLIRRPDGQPMTCASIVGARTRAELAAAGAGCP